MISTTHYILKVLAANFPPSKSTWRSLSYFYLGESYYKMDMYSQAAGQFKKIVENFSDSPVLNWSKLGLAYSNFELNDFKAAKQAAQDLMNTGDAPAKLKVYSSLIIAHSLFNSKKYEEAVYKYEQFAKENSQMPEAGEALFYAGQAYFQLEYYANAIEDWKKVVNSYRNSDKAPESAYLMGDTFFKAQKYEEAIAAYKLLEQWPEDVNPHRKEIDIHIAQCYYNAKQDDKAIAAYTKFIKEHPEDLKTKDAM